MRLKHVMATRAGMKAARAAMANLCDDPTDEYAEKAIAISSLLYQAQALTDALGTAIHEETPVAMSKRL